MIFDGTSQFELILENGNSSTTRVFTPSQEEEGGQSLDDVLLDLKNFSGTLRVRRIATPQTSNSDVGGTRRLDGISAPQIRSTEEFAETTPSQMPTLAEEPWGRIQELESSSSLPTFQDHHGLEALLSHPRHFASATDIWGAASAQLTTPESSEREDFHLPLNNSSKEQTTLPEFPSPLLPMSIRSQSATSTGSVPASCEFGMPSPPPIPGASNAATTDRAKSTDHSFVSKPRQSRRRMHKRTSMRELAQLDSFSDTQGQTTLHRVCASSQSKDIFPRLHDLVQRFPDMVKAKDSNGRLPLHVLGNNSDLINFNEGQKAATKCALVLMDAYPEGIVAADHDGRMPFTYLILKWVEWAFDHGDENSRGKQDSIGSADQCSVTAVISKLNRKLQSMHSITATKRTSGDISSHSKDSSKMSFSQMVTNGGSLNASQGRSLIKNLRDSMTKSSHRFPPIMIFDEVEWCFEMLSYGMDHLGGKPLDPGKKVRPTLAYTKQRENRDALAQNIAEIPGLFKTVLLVESKQIRSFILDCSAMRRTMFCTDTVGPWLTSMIRYRKGNSSEVALDFLQTLSRLSTEDYIGTYRKALPHDEKEFHNAKLKVYKQVEKLGDIIPTLLIAGEHATNKAVATSLVCFIMNRQMATPFTVGNGLAEFFLNLTGMLAFRQTVIERTPENNFFKLFPWMTLNSVFFWVAVHQLMSKICEFVALSRIDKRTAKKVAFGWWSMVEMSGIILATGASIFHDRKTPDEDEHSFFMAVILGLLWVRLLGFLKVINEQLATFILALTRMLYDIRFFAVVLFVFVLTFGDMFQLVVRNHDDIDCTQVELDPAIEEYCSPRSIDSYLRTYAIVVGDFEFEQYNDLGGVTFLWFCTTFLGTVVMLNVLIAIVTLSYSSSQESSVLLFRRARAQFLASHAIMERFVRPSLAQWAKKTRTNGLGFISLICLRWLLLLTWVAAALWCTLYIIEATIFTFRNNWYVVTFPYALLCLAMLLQLWCAAAYILIIFFEQVLPQGKARNFVQRYVEKTTERILKKMISSIYGTDRNDTESGEVAVGQSADLIARLEKLETLLHQVLAKKEREEEEQMEATFEDAPLMPFQEDDELDTNSL